MVKYDGRWFNCFKWKPPEQNTIDFRIAFKMDSENKQNHLVKHISKNDEIVSYKVAVLNVGYNPMTHTEYNACRVVNEELTFKEGYHNVPFQPYNPYIKNIELVYLPLTNGMAYCTNKDIINDDSVVEFSYDNTKGEGFCWVPTRVRNVNNPNDFLTAINNWRTLHNPVETNMITSGNTPDTDEVYYYNTKDRKTIPTKPLADFHSYVKKNLITSNCKGKTKKSLMDVSCGRGGEFNHWLDSNLENIICLDINRDNLESKNGACNRVLNNMVTSKNRVLKNIMMIWGDSSKTIKNGEAAKDDLNEYYLNVLYGNTTKETINNSKLKRFYGIANSKFDVISCQFSIHYFFEKIENLNTFLENIRDNLKEGGKFIGTCMDGKKIFNLLNNNIELSKSKNDEVLKIIKRYDQTVFKNDDTSIGYEIDVYVNSGKTTKEYLVNFDYLKDKLSEYDLEIENIEEFESIYEKMNKKNVNYGVLQAWTKA